jgi:hypothetical protein
VAQAELLVKAQQDVGEVMGELGLAFIKLAKFETEKTMLPCQSVFVGDAKRTATAAVKASRFYRESNSLCVKHLVSNTYLFLCLLLFPAKVSTNCLQSVASTLYEEAQNYTFLTILRKLHSV